MNVTFLPYPDTSSMCGKTFPYIFSKFSHTKCPRGRYSDLARALAHRYVGLRNGDCDVAISAIELESKRAHCTPNCPLPPLLPIYPGSDYSEVRSTPSLVLYVWLTQRCRIPALALDRLTSLAHAHPSAMAAALLPQPPRHRRMLPPLRRILLPVRILAFEHRNECQDRPPGHIFVRGDSERRVTRFDRDDRLRMAGVLGRAQIQQAHPDSGRRFANMRNTQHSLLVNMRP